jgi:hypothetical protein
MDCRNIRHETGASRLLSGNDKNEKEKKEAERRQTRIKRAAPAQASLRSLRKPSASCGARWKAQRARLSAFHHGACCGERTPQLSSKLRASWDLVGRTIPIVRKTVRVSTHDPEKWLPVFRQDHAPYHGRYPRLPVPVQRVSPQTGHHAGRAYYRRSRPGTEVTNLCPREPFRSANRRHRLASFTRARF